MAAGKIHYVVIFVSDAMFSSVDQCKESAHRTGRIEIQVIRISIVILQVKKLVALTIRGRKFSGRQIS